MDEYALIVNVDCAVVREDSYLCIERAATEAHAAGSLAFPGGKVEPDAGPDAIEATARREVREEVGVEIGAAEFVCSRTFELDTGARCLNVVTVATYEDGEARPNAPAEVAAVHWLSPAEIREHEATPDFLRADLDRVESAR